MATRIIPIQTDPALSDPERRFTPPRAWAPMTDAEWATIEPLIQRLRFTGRPVDDVRNRINAVFHVAVTGKPWRLLPEGFGKPDTVSRHFRRWAHGKLWLWLLSAARDPSAPKPLRAMEYWLCRAARRAMRILGLDGAETVEQMGALSAMPVLPQYMPRPENLRFVQRWQRSIITATMADPLSVPIGKLRDLLRLERIFRGRPWGRKWAPP
jgi:transposase